VQQRLHAPDYVKPTAGPEGGPEVVVDYSFEEKKPWEALNTRSTDPRAPLVLRNISLTDAAYNVCVLPLTIDGETAVFEPAIVPYIEPQGRKEVSTRITGGPPLSLRSLPTFLMRSYKDSSVDELFGV
jgi:hypothetical protein